jgi:monofunctional biosynthetic peptidoglycan transglycosylase
VARSGKTAGAARKKPAGAAKAPTMARRHARLLGRLTRRAAKVVGWALLGVALAVLMFAFVNPPLTHTIWAEGRRLGRVERDWVAAEAIAPVMLRAAVAAEDANFCLHWGFDMAAIRDAIEEGAARGASTISQQVVKNVFLWQGRSWIRKALEAALTPMVEVLWSKRRILEVYLNVAEFGEGVFGVEAAARHYYGVPAAELSPRQAARLAVLLPNPRERDPNALSPRLRRLAAQAADGAETIRADGRAACFES